MEQTGPLRIDLRQILSRRVPRAKRRWVPGWLARWGVRRLERLVRQDELNGILERTYPATGTAFAAAALRDLDITVSVRGLENVPEGGRYVFASNHPLGGLDGITLIAVLGARYGDDLLRFPVNDLLMNVRPLQGVFIPVNKFGRQGRDAARLLADTFASQAQIAYFPAGLCSRLQKGGRVADEPWQKAFVAKALQTGRSIVPVHFEGHNSRRFYRVARWRKRLGLRINIEQALLPSELCRARGSHFTVTFGAPVSCEELRATGLPPLQLAAEIRRRAYALAPGQ